jgi:peptide/nickel transport system substrate-binding protein
LTASADQRIDCTIKKTAGSEYRQRTQVVAAFAGLADTRLSAKALREGGSMNHRRHFGRLWAVAEVAAVLVFALIAGSGSAVAASSTSSPAASVSPGSLVLRIGWTTEPDNLNPFIGWQNPDYEIWAINYDFLFGFGRNQQPTLDLAREFPTKQNGGISADGKVWTIKLRQGVKWSDGQPFTAADVAFTYNYIVQNNMANMTLSTDGIVSAEALDPTTVRIVCSYPKADMEHIYVPILPKHVWDKVSPNAAITSFQNAPPIVGTGPFQVVQFSKGNYVRMLRNPYYWGKRPTLNEILFEMYQNPISMVSDLKSGALDAAWGIPPAEFPGVKAMKSMTALAYPYYNWEYLNFNCYAKPSSKGNPVLKDWRFRQALNYAIDRNRIVSVAYNGYAAPGTTILPPNTWRNPDYHWQPSASQAYTFNLAKAGQMLTSAGYPLKNGVRVDKQGKPITLRLWATTDDDQAQVAGRLITGWLDQLGLHIQLSVIDSGSLLAGLWNYSGKVYSPDFDMYINDWLGYLDPGETLVTNTTSQIGATNEPSWSNATYDQLCAQQARALNPQARQALIWRAQQVMYEQSPWIVFAYPEYFEAYDTQKWTGWTRVNDGTGPAFFTSGNVDTYLNLAPPSATVATGSGGHVAVWIFAAAAAAVVVAVVIVVRRRRSTHAALVEE